MLDNSLNNSICLCMQISSIIINDNVGNNCNNKIFCLYFDYSDVLNLQIFKDNPTMFDELQDVSTKHNMHGKK